MPATAIRHQTERERLIQHAIKRAKERYGWDLTSSEIERLSHQYRTASLPVIEVGKGSKVGSKEWEALSNRNICYSTEFRCYVAYDEEQRVVVTFLPPDFDPRKPIQGLSLSNRRTLFVPSKPTIIRWKHDEKIQKLPKMKLPKTKQQEPQDVWFLRDYITVDSPAKARKITLQWQQYLTDWYCQQRKIPVFFGPQQPENPGTTAKRIVLPDGSLQKFVDFYLQHRGEIWEYIESLFEDPSKTLTA